MKATILNALTGHSNPNTVPFSCLTGNSTFSKPHASLAMCHKCEDVTPSIQPKCPGYYLSPGKGDIGHWTLPKHKDLRLIIDIHDGNAIVLLNFSSNRSAYSSHDIFSFPSPECKQKFEARPQVWWEPTSSSFACPSSGSGISKNNRTVQAVIDGNKTTVQHSLVEATCSLFPCVRRYTAEVRNSVIFERGNLDNVPIWGRSLRF